MTEGAEIVKVEGMVELETEEDLILHSHSMAMSKDPTEAAHGRFSKKLAVAMMQWLIDEDARGTEFKCKVLAFHIGMTNLAMTFASNEVREDRRAKFLANFLMAMRVSLNAAMEAAKAATKTGAAA